jgi:MFS family permease
MGTFTTAMLSASRARKAMVGIIAGFFIQGFMAVAWVPRIPEIIDNINVPFSAWGLIVGLAGVGSLIPLLFASKLVNRFGSRPLLQVSFVVACLAFGSFGFIHNPTIFFVALFSQNFAYGVYNIVVNAHSVVFQDRIGRVILGRFHASWSIGAALSALLTGVFATFVPLNTYLAIAAGVSGVVCIIGTALMLGPREDGHEQEHRRASSVPLFKTPRYVLILAFGLFFAVLPEAIVIDWSAIFSKKVLHLAPGWQGAPYSLFVIAMIVGRLALGRLSRRRHLSRIGQLAAILGAVSLTIAVTVGTLLANISPMLALAVTAVFWILTGLGAGPQVPAIFSNGGTVETMTTAQAMSRMSLMNSLLILLAKVLMGAMAQGIAVESVFVLALLAFVGVSLIHRYLVQRSKIHPAPAGYDDEPVDAFPVTSPLDVITADEIMENRGD